MAFQPCPGIASAVISASSGAGADEFQNVLHFKKSTTAPWSGTELQGLLDGLHAFLTSTPGIAATQTYLSAAVSLERIALRDLTVDAGAEKSLNISIPGASSATPLNSGLSFAITLRTGLAGRSQRGRLFCYGLTTAINGSHGQDVVDSAAANAISAGWAGIIAAQADWGSGVQWCVLSRRHKVGDTPNVLRDTGVGTPITGTGYSNLVIDFQRRRAPMHARHN